MSFADIRDRLVNLLEGVEGIGIVHGFRRHPRFWEDYLKNSAKDGRINAWEVTRTAFADSIARVGGAVSNEPLFRHSHAALIIGYMGVVDAAKSEVDFQTLIDLIADKIRKNPRLGNFTIVPETLQGPVIEHRMLGDTLVHYTELTFAAHERVEG